MKFTPLKFGAYLVVPEPFIDNRGDIVRITCIREFLENGLLQSFWSQSGFVHTPKKGTVRGFHRQFEQAKFYYVLQGEIWDILIKDGETHEILLNEGRGIYIPEGIFHGFQTLANDTQMLYYTSDFYNPELEERMSCLEAEWPLAITEVSEKDRT